MVAFITLVLPPVTVIYSQFIFNLIRLCIDLSESFAIEKKELVNEIVKLKKQLDRQHLDNSRRDAHITEVKREADMGLSALQEADSKISVYRREVSWHICYYKHAKCTSKRLKSAVGKGQSYCNGS